jgi:hypothetical protein
LKSLIHNPEILGDTKRAEDVFRKLHALKSTMEDSFIDTCYLLLESLDNGYHICWGYTRFTDWVDASDLDMKGRQALYYTNIARKSQTLGLSRDDLKRVKISKLKEIFALDPQDFKDEMLQLVGEAEDSSLEEVKNKVRSLRSASGRPDSVYMTLKFDTDIKELVDEAFELARRNYGDLYVGESGETIDISDSKCLELICQQFLMDPNNHPEEIQTA